MPSREWKFRIQDIIDSIDKIEQYLDGIDLVEFNQNSLIHDAVIRNLEIIKKETS